MPHSTNEYPMPRKPLIGVSACTKQIGHHSFHIAGDKYLRAAAIAGVPLLALDMYEHSFHMDYGTAAAKYVDAFFRNIDWEVVDRRYAAALRGGG